MSDKDMEKFIPWQRQIDVMNTPGRRFVITSLPIGTGRAAARAMFNDLHASDVKYPADPITLESPSFDVGYTNKWSHVGENGVTVIDHIKLNWVSISLPAGKNDHPNIPVSTKASEESE